MPHDMLLVDTRVGIDNNGIISFPNEAGMSLDSFLELFGFYWKSMLAVFEGTFFTQSTGVCTGSDVAAVLSDILVAKMNRSIPSRTKGTEVLIVIRYVIDFLVAYKDVKRDGASMIKKTF